MRPTVTPTADEIFDDLGPIGRADSDDTGWAALLLLNAVLDLYNPLDIAARADGTVWGYLLDVDETPDDALDWLAQFPGAITTPSMDAAAKRTAITDHPGWKRGTPAAIVAALQAVLTGTKRVTLVERWDGQAYQLAVWVYAAEVPSVSAVTAAVTAQKPATLMLQGATVQAGATYYDLDHEFTDYDAMNTAFATYDAMKTYVPTY